MLAQPPVVGTSAPVARFGSTKSGPAAETYKPAPDVAKSAFTSAQAGVSSGYRTVSASTDEFAHESPWKSIAFAAGGITIVMLIARKRERLHKPLTGCSSRSSQLARRFFQASRQA